MKSLTRVFTLALATCSVSTFLQVPNFAAVAQDPDPPWNERVDGPLPRWREGGTPADDPAQALHPYTIQSTGGPIVGMPPTSGWIQSPPEYGPTAGVLFRYSPGSWSQVVTDCVAALTGDPSKDEVAHVVVSNPSHVATAMSQFSAAGADLSKVLFFQQPTDSIWLRDYGPHFIWQSGALALADSHYYPTRPNDNFIPTLLAEDEYEIPPYPMGLYYSGGNFQPGPNASGFTTSLVHQDNPGFGESYVAQLFQAFQGIQTLHIMPRLPSAVDGTGHIDMWMYLVDTDSVIISEFLPGSNPDAITITENAVPYMEALGFTVTRVPAWNVGSTHYTYTNAFRVNDRIFVPTYASGNPAYLTRDQQALNAWQLAAGPSVEIVPIDCYSIIPAAGAIHCIVMQVPRYTAPTPSAHVVSPDGQELLVTSSTVDLHWAATDNVEVTEVDLSASLDGGLTFPISIATGEENDGHFAWTVPPGPSTTAIVRAEAFDRLGASDVALSSSAFEIRSLARHVYDFGTGAGVDKWAWGSSTWSWAALEATRYPADVSSEIEAITPGAYAQIAASDATGDDSDPNRYHGFDPGEWRETTHVFEFALDEDPAMIHDIELRWEGYGDQCLQMELYVWDLVAGNWCDADAAVGENAYAANYAGNRDWNLVAHIRSDVSRFVDPQGHLTLLVYGERPSEDSFHDYVAVTTSYELCQEDLGYGGPGAALLAVCGDDLALPGSHATLALTQAAPLSPLGLFVGFAENPTLVGGGLLVPVPWFLADFSQATDATGALQLEVAGWGGGPLQLFAQVIVLNGLTLEFSNALELNF